ncbi:MAG: M23 family metallopeptidase [Ardenticatenaceae bacterium]|nr:M23 family metallopeptidase [Ardenticatenaceae bacterium]
MITQTFHRWRANLKRPIIIIPLLIVILFVIYFAVTLFNDIRDPRSQGFVQWRQGDEATREALITVQRDACPGAPFILPADGYIGLLYDDPRGPYSRSTPHQGIDIFSDTEPGITPVYAAYDGYVTREADWRSTLIMRVPQDPLQPDRQVWLYYTHMADREGNDFIVDAFPPGTRELFVEQGTLLGYTGNYNGDSPRTVWVHLHFSVVLDDGNGRYLNELDINNTLDPSPYFGLNVNYSSPQPISSNQPVCEA